MRLLEKALQVRVLHGKLRCGLAARGTAGGIMPQVAKAWLENGIHKIQRTDTRTHYACGAWYFHVGTHRNDRKTKKLRLEVQLMTVHMATGTDFWAEPEEK